MPAFIEILARFAPRATQELEHLGVPFNQIKEGKIAQRTFGGHTRNFGKAHVKRACYAADRTGRVILKKFQVANGPITETRLLPKKISSTVFF